MKQKPARYFISSFYWVTITKILDACIKFLTIPLLLRYFGKENYGLLTLALATNAYMRLLDMGMNTGGVKFFSQWLAIGKYNLINRVARTNITFYLTIGLINSIILISLGLWGANLFKITQEQISTFQSLLFILAAFSIINWVTFVFNQLLVANEKIAFTQKILTLKSIGNFIIIITTIYFNWSLVQYFTAYLFIGALVILPYYYLCKKTKLIRSILPGFYWKDFSIVFKYGTSILALSIFQFTSTQSRPLILGIFSTVGVGILTEYRIIEVFPAFIISIGGMLTSILLPKTSKAIQNNDRANVEKIAYEGTIYTSILVSFLCFPIMLNAGELITLYVGAEYSHLTKWLVLWVLTLTLFLHNTPVSSLVLATGKIRMLVYSSAFACILSIIINAMLTNNYGVGSAVLGYLVYIIIQMSFYYFYFNNKVLKLKSLKIFTSFIMPTALGYGVLLLVKSMKIPIKSLPLYMIISSIIWAMIYLTALHVFKILDIKTIYKNLKKVRT